MQTRRQKLMAKYRPKDFKSDDEVPFYPRGLPEQPLSKTVKRFRGGLVFKAHRLLYHSTLGLRVIKKIMKK